MVSSEAKFIEKVTSAFEAEGRLRWMQAMKFETTPSPELAEGVPWLLSREASDLRFELHEAGRLNSAHHDLLRRHLLRIKARSSTREHPLQAFLHSNLDVDSRPVPVYELASELGRLQEDRRRHRIAQALERCAEDWVAPFVDRALEVDDSVASKQQEAAEILDSTEELARALSDVHFKGRSWSHVVEALASDAEASLFRADTRFRRFAEAVAPLGLNSRLASLRGDRVAMKLPSYSVIALRPPGDIRLVVPQFGGVLAECMEFEVFGSAFSLLLRAPSLPVFERFPLDSGLYRSVGVLWGQLLADREFLRRVYSLSRNQAESIARRLVLWFCMRLRWEAARLWVASTEGRERSSLVVALVQRLFAVEVPEALSQLILLSGEASYERMRDLQCGLALHGALRERYNEDWFRNPRSVEALYALSQRGSSLTHEQVQTELGLNDYGVSHRLGELFDP